MQLDQVKQKFLFAARPRPPEQHEDKNKREDEPHPVLGHKVAGVDQGLRRQRELSLHLFKNADEFRHEESQHDKNRADPDDEHHHRIGQRRLDLAPHLLFLLPVFSDLIENFIENAALFPRLDHAQEQVIKNLWVAPHAFGKGFSVFDLLLEIIDNDPKRMILRLLSDQRQGSEDRNARLDQARQLPGERVDIFRPDLPDARCGPLRPGTLIFLSRRGRAGLLGNADRDQVHLIKFDDHLIRILRHHIALDDLVGASLGLVMEFWHVSPPNNITSMTSRRSYWIK